MSSGFIQQLATVAEGMAAIASNAKHLKQTGLVSREEAEQAVKAEIERDYKNNENFRRDYERKVDGYRRGNGLAGNADNLFRQLLGKVAGNTGIRNFSNSAFGRDWLGITDDTDRNNPHKKAMDNEIASRMAARGWKPGQEFQTEDNVKKAAEAAAKEYRAALDRAQKNGKPFTPQELIRFRGAQTPEAVKTAEQQIYAERKAAIEEAAEAKRRAAEEQEKREAEEEARFLRRLQGMDEEIRMQRLKNDDKEREAEIAKEIDRAEKSKGRALTETERAEVEERAGTLYDLRNKQSNQSERQPLQMERVNTSDVLARIGGRMGITSSANNLEQRQVSLLGDIKKAVNELPKTIRENRSIEQPPRFPSR